MSGAGPVWAVPIDRPIFILGPGRAGSTLLNSIVTLHRDAAYFNAWSNRFPHVPALAVASRLRLGPLEPWVMRKGVRRYPGATEAYNIWKYCFPDFWSAVRGPCADETGAERLRHLMRVHLRLQGGTRFVSKLTGPPMMRFFASIFPDAQFVRIERDPRAVAYSYIEQGWLPVAAGVVPGELPRTVQVQLAAKRYLDHFAELKAEPGDYLVVAYEDLVVDAPNSVARIESYTGLSHDARLERRARSWPMVPANRRWVERLDRDDRTLLTELLEEALEAFGYRP